MLAVSDTNYYLPVKTVQDDGSIVWVIQRRDSVEKIMTSQFKYTIGVSHVLPAIDRITFEYNGRSVKAAPRSLRICGAERIEWFTKVLANQTTPSTYYEFVSEGPDGKVEFGLVTED